MFSSAKVLLVILVSLFLLSGVFVSPTSVNTRSYAQSSDSSQPWHQGTNESTPQVDVNYTQQFSQGVTETTNETSDLLSGGMTLRYMDGTGEMIALTTTYAFTQGGINMSDDQVLNWSDVFNAGINLNTWATVNKTAIGTIYSFMGFDIVNGTANQFNLTRNNLDFGNNTCPGCFDYSVNNIIGSINYANASSISIGAVSLSTANTTYDGNTLTESIAKFNVTVDALMSDLPLPPIPPQMQNLTDDVPVPVVLMFTVIHDTAQTNIKYGVSINWNATKAFPVAKENGDIPGHELYPANFTTGDNFSLVAQDRLSFAYGSSQNTMVNLPTFSSDALNDSAIYYVNNTQLCKEQFPTNFTMLGSSQLYNTTRDYIPVSWQTTWNQSSIFVVFGGFKYNESSGFMFDPAVITPNSVSVINNPNPNPNNTNPTTYSSAGGSKNNNPSNLSGSLSVIIPVAVVVAIAAGTVVVVKRRSSSKS